VSPSKSVSGFSSRKARITCGLHARAIVTTARSDVPSQSRFSSQLRAAVAADTRGFAELVVGVAEPIGDDSFKGALGTGLHFGVRGGAMWRRLDARGSVGVEVGIDATKLGEGPLPYTQWSRMRSTAGVRVAFEVTPRWSVFARSAAGITQLTNRYSRTYYDENTSKDVGVVVQFGGGVLVGTRDLAGGAQIGYSTAQHDRLLYGGGFRADDVEFLFTFQVRVLIEEPFRCHRRQADRHFAGPPIDQRCRRGRERRRGGRSRTRA
jgi:hypothetical protein